MYQVKVLPSAAGSTISSAGRLDYVAGASASYTLPVTTLSVAATADVSVTNALSPRVSVVGSTITDTVTVTNAGPGTAVTPKVNDTFSAGVQNMSWVSASSSAGVSCPASVNNVTQCTLPNLPVGSSAVIVFTGRMPSNAAVPGTVTNTAQYIPTTVDPNAANNSATDTISLSREADVAVSVSPASPTVVPGQQQTYTVTATNNGPSDAVGTVTVTDVVDSGSRAAMSLVSVTPGTGSPACSLQTASDVSCTVASLAAGASVSFTVVAQTSPSATAGASISQTASVSSATTDPVTSNNTAKSTGVIGTASADMRVSASVAPSPLVAGNSVTYTLDVGNWGPSDAAGVSLVDVVPSGLTNVAATTDRGTCSVSGSTVTCGLGAMPASLTLGSQGATGTIRITGDIPAGQVSSLVNSATLTASTADPVSSNNTSTLTTPVTASADVSVAVTGSMSSFPATGDPVVYTIRVHNDGPSAAQGVTVSSLIPLGLGLDPANAPVVPSGVTCGTSLGAGDATHAGWTCSVGSVGVGTANDVVIKLPLVATQNGAAPMVATMTVASTTPDPVMGNNQATWTMSGNPEADLAISATAAPDPFLAGQAATYTVQVTNNGPSASVPSVTVTLPTGLALVPAGAAGSQTTSVCTGSPTSTTVTCADTAPLASGASRTYTVSVAVSPDLLDGASVSASATVTGSILDPTTSNNSASVTSRVSAEANLSVTDVWWQAYTGQGNPPTTPVGSGLTSAPAGNFVWLTMTVTNTGSATAWDSTILVDHDLPLIDAPFFDGSPVLIWNGGAWTATGCVVVSGEIECDVNNGASGTAVRPGDMVTLSVLVGVDDAAAPTSGSATVSVGTSTPQAGSAVTSMSAPLSVTAGQSHLTVTKSAGTGSGPSGESVAGTEFSYTIDVTQTRDATAYASGQSWAQANGVTVTDVLPSGFHAVDALSTQGSCTISGSGSDQISCALESLPGTLAPGPYPVATVTIVGTLDTSVTGPTVTNTATVATTTPSDGPYSAQVTSPVVQQADLELLMAVDSTTATTAGGDPIYLAGQDVGYTLTVINAGPSDAGASTVTDTLPVGVSLNTTASTMGCAVSTPGTLTTAEVVTCPAPALAMGASAVLRVVGSTLPTDLRASGTGPGCVPGQPSDPSDPGSTPNAAGCGSYPALPRTLTNSATVAPVSAALADPDATNNTASVDASLDAAADLAATLLVNNEHAPAGAQVTYTLTGVNTGPSIADDPEVVATFPAGFTPVSSSIPGWDCAWSSSGTPAASTLTCTKSPAGPWYQTMVPGEAVSGTITMQIPAGAAEVTHTATVSVTSASTTDPNTGNNTASVDVAVQQISDLVVTKTLTTPNPLVTGYPGTYRVTVTNNGPSVANQVTVYDPVVSGMSFQSGTTQAGQACTDMTSSDGTTDQVICSMGSLAVGASAWADITMMVDPTTTATQLCNTAFAGSASSDPNAANSQATACALVLPPPPTDVSLAMTPHDSFVYPNGEVGVTATVTNNGPEVSTNTTLTVTLPTGLTGVTGLLDSAPSGVAPDAVCTVSGAQMVCSIGTLPSGASVAYDIIGYAPGPAGTTYTLTGVVTHREVDLTPANDQASASIDVVAVPTTAVSVTKTVSPTSPILVAGAQLTYTLTLTNAGLDPAVVDHVDDLSNVLDDATFGTVSTTGPVTATLFANQDLIITGTLARGQSATVTYTVTVKPDGQRGDSKVFNAVFSADTDPGDRPDPDTPPTDCPTCVDSQVAGVTLVKTATPTQVGLPGDSVAYSYLVTNVGTVTLTGVSVTDTAFTGAGSAPVVNCPMTTVGAGASVTCAATYMVTGTDIAGTGWSNTATATATAGSVQVTSAASTATVGVRPSTDVGVSLSPATQEAYPSAEFGLTATVVNNGPNPATGVSVSIPVPTGVTDLTGTLVSSSGGVSAAGSCPISGSVMTCAIGAVGAGAQVVYDIVGWSAPTVGTTHTFTASVSHGEVDADTSNDSAMASVDVVAVPAAQIQVTKSVSPSTGIVFAGAVLTYTVTVSNTGTAPGVVDYVDDLSHVLGNATFSTVTASPGLDAYLYANQDMIITGTLDPGQTATVTYSVTVKPDGQRVDNRLFNDVTSADTPPEDRPDPDNPPPTCPTCVSTEVAGVSVTATASVPSVSAPGDPITFSYLVTNSGSVGLTNLSVTGTGFTGTGVLTPVSCPTTTLAVGASTTCTASYVTTAADMATAWISSTVTASGMVSGQQVTSAPATASVSTSPTTDVGVTLVAGQTKVYPDSEIGFTATVINNGPTDATGVTLSVTIPSGVLNATGVLATAPTGLTPGATCSLSGATLTCQIGNLPVGKAVVYDLLAQASGPVGSSYTLSASVTRDQIDTVASNDTAQATVQVVAAATPGLQVSKTVSPTLSVVTAGTVLTYTLTFTNTGTAPAVIDHVDTVSNVLDDAVVGSIQASPGMQAQLYANGDLVMSGTLDPGQVMTVSYTATLKPDGQRGDSILFNDVVAADTVPAERPEPGDDCPTCVTTDVAGLAVSATADPTTVTSATPIGYQFAVTNTGSVPVTGVSVSPQQFTGSGALTGISCPVTSLAVGASTVCTTTYQVTPADLTGSQLSLTVAATGSVGAQAVTSPTSTVNVTVSPEVDMEVALSPAGTQVYPNAETGVTATVVNNGPTAASGVKLTVTIPSGLVGVTAAVASAPSGSAASTCTTTGTQIVCLVGGLGVGQSVSYDLIGVASVPASAGFTVAASVTSDQIDTVPGNNTATARVDVVAMPVPDLTVTKSVSPTGAVLASGSVLTYTLSFTNPGTAPAVVDHVDDLSNVLDDATIGTITADTGLTARVYANQDMIITGTIPAGATLTVTYPMTVKPDGQRGDSVLFNDVVSADVPAGDRPDPRTPPDQCPTCTTTQISGIGLVQVASPSSVGTAGQQATFTYQVTNTGTIALTGISVASSVFTGTGTLPAPVCPSTTLAAGASMSCQSAYTTTSADLGLSQIANTATATAMAGTSPVTSSAVTAAIDVNPGADVAVTMTPASTQVYPNAQFGVTATVVNTGPGTATGVTATIAVPAGVSSVTGLLASSSDATPRTTACTVAGATVTCPVGALAPGESVSYDLLGTVAGPAPATRTLTASVTHNETDPVTSNNQAQASLQVVATPSVPLATSKTVSPSDPVVTAGATLVYAVTITNPGSSPAVVDYMDDLTGILDDTTVSGVAATGGLSANLYATGDLIVTGTLAPGASGTVTYTATVKPDGQRGDSLLFNAVVAADTPPAQIPDPVNPPEDCQSCTHTSVAGLSAVASADPDVVAIVGGMSTFTIQATNTGDTPVTGLGIQQSSFTGTGTLGSWVCAPTTVDVGQMATCTAGYTVTANDIATGPVVFTGTATGMASTTGVAGSTSVSSTPVTAQIATTSATQAADLAVSVVPTFLQVYPGGEVGLTATVTNNGPGAASGATLTWTIPAGLTSVVGMSATPSTGLLLASGCLVTGTQMTCAVGSLGVGQSVAYDLIGWVTGPVGSTFPVSAQVAETGTDPVSGNNTAQVAVQVVAPPAPGITMSKTADPVNTVVQAGAVVTYTVTVTNTSLVSAVVHQVDDMSGVLDDATIVSVTPGTGLDAVLLANNDMLITGTLASGQSSTVTYQVRVNPDGQRGDNQLFNAVVAGDTPVADRPDTTTPPDQCTACTDTLVTGLGLGVSATPTSVTQAGGTITYQFAVTNEGTVPVTGLALAPVRFTGTGPVSPVCSVTSLNPGASTTCTATYSVTAADMTTPRVSGTWTASGVASGQQVTSAPASVAVPVASEADLGVTMSAASAQVYPGAETGVSATVTNNGPANATQATVTIDVPTGMTGATAVLASSTDGATRAPSCASSGSQLICQVGALPVGASVTYDILGTVTAPVGSTPTVTARAAQAGVDPVPGNDQASTAFTVVAVPATPLTVTKTQTSPDDPLVTGSVVTYTLTFTNPGASPAVVDHVDDLSTVLGVASLGPVQTTPGLTAQVFTSDHMLITGTVGAGASGNVTYTATVKPVSERTGTQLFNAVVSADTPVADRPTPDTPPAQCPACTSDTVPEPVTTTSTDVTVALTPALTQVYPGAQVGLTATVTNNGPAAATDVTVTLPLPAGLVGVTGLLASAPSGTSPATACQITQTDLVCPVGNLGVGQSVSYDVVGTMSAPAGASYTLTATATHDETDPNPATSSAQAVITVVAKPDPGVVTMTKTVTPASGLIEAGATLTYTITLSNTGSTPAVADMVDSLADVLDDAVVSGIQTTGGVQAALYATGDLIITGTIPGGGTATVTYVATVKPDGQRGDSKVFNSVVTADVTPADRPTVDTPPAQCTTCTDSDVTGFDGAPDPAHTGQSGDTVTVDYTVTNTGSTPIEDLALQADASGTGTVQVSCPTTTVAPGESVTCTATYTLTPEDLAAGEVTITTQATGTVDGQPVTTPPSTTTVPVVQPTDVAVTWTSPGTPVYPGAQFGLTATVTNKGPVDATDVAVTFDIPAGMVGATVYLASASPGTTPATACTQSGSTITCPIGDLAVGQSVSYDLIATASGAVGADYSVGATITQTGANPTPADAHATTAVTVVAKPAPGVVTMTKTVSPASGLIEAGTVLSYTITLKNTGSTPAVADMADSLADVLDDAVVSGVQTTGGVQATLYANQDLIITGTVPGGGTATVTYTVTVKPDGQRGDSKVFNSVVTADVAPADRPTVDTPPAQCTTCTDSDVTGFDVATDPTHTGQNGDTVTVEYTVTNTGSTPIEDLALEVVDASGTGTIELSCPTTTVAPGESVTCTATYTLTPEDIAAGDVTITTQATGTVDGQPVTTPPSTTTVPVAEPTDVAVTWTSGGTPVYPGAQIGLTAQVVNYGPTDATDVTVTFDIPAGMTGATIHLAGASAGTTPESSCVQTGATFTCTIGNLAVGQSVSYDIVAWASGSAGADYAVGATVSHTGGASTPADAHATTDVTVVAPPTTPLSVAKTVTPASAVVKAGDRLTYTITIANPGSVPAVVDHLDDLATVLDAATVSAPVATGALRASVYAGRYLIVTGTLAPGASATVTYAATVLPDGQRDSLPLFNAVVAANTPVADRPDTTTPPAQCPACTTTGVAGITTQVDMVTPPPTKAGDPIGYEITVTNDGTVPLSGLTPHVDSTGTGQWTTSCPIGTLMPGQSMVCTAVYTVTEHDMATGDVTNNVSVSGDTPGLVVSSTPTDITVPLAEPTDVAVTWTSGGTPVYPGAQFGLTATVTNKGPADATHVTVTFDIPDGMTGATIHLTGSSPGTSPTSTCTQSGATMTCAIGNLGVGQWVTYDIVGWASGAPGASYTVGATVAQAGANPIPGDAHATTAVTVVTVPATPLGVTKTVTPASPVVKAGDQLTYTITITNPEAVPAVVDHLDDLATVLDAATVSTPTATGTLKANLYAGRYLIITGTLAPGASATVTYTATVLPDGQRDSLPLFNAVVAANTPVADRPDTTTPPDQCAACTTTGVGGLIVQVDQVTPPPTKAGDPIGYQITVTNDGTVPLSGIVPVVDSTGTGEWQVSCPLDTLPPGQSMVCTATYTVTEQDIANGGVTTNITVTGDAIDLVITSTPTDITVPLGSGTGGNGGNGGNGGTGGTGAPTIPTGGTVASGGTAPTPTGAGPDAAILTTGATRRTHVTTRGGRA
ncbi:MAG: hypothetical protein FWD75_01170 [Propionibacteriaceae bacterium]|nr:hypothetical protein [Propionibacteriaceae bacterium]